MIIYMYDYTYEYMIIYDYNITVHDYNVISIWLQYMTTYDHNITIHDKIMIIYEEKRVNREFVFVLSLSELYLFFLYFIFLES